MAENLYLVEDCLLNLRRMILEHGANGLTFSAEEIKTLAAMLFELSHKAKLQAFEISRHRWNAAARADGKAETALILAELERPGSNVALFPIIQRPFTDDRPGGAA
jgi:hypothetical protein